MHDALATVTIQGLSPSKGTRYSRLFHCIESVITLCARAPEKVILNLPSNGVRYIGVNRLCHGVTNLLNVKKSRYHEEQLNK